MKKVFLIFLVAILPNWSYSQNFADIDRLLSIMEKKYKLKIYYNKMPKTSWPLGYKFAEESDSSHLFNYLKLLNTELDKYPPGFIKRTNLKTIVTVKSLSYDGQYRAAIPDYYNEILLYDFKEGNIDKIYQQHVIHHEYYHMIEEEFNGDPLFKDPEWMSLNSDSVKYGTGGEAMNNMDLDVYSYTHPQAGFVNLYSTSGIEEDKAEIFASLFVKSESDSLNIFIKNDEFLDKKKDYMINFLYELDSAFDIDYWEKLHLSKSIKTED